MKNIFSLGSIFPWRGNKWENRNIKKIISLQVLSRLTSMFNPFYGGITPTLV